ncbi:hypothetical protein [Ruegeria sp.]|uniref:hypothetical protein n=1 Tax=Ruegeria sp. TaxID=1879320 RepID=UPI003B599E08
MTRVLVLATALIAAASGVAAQDLTVRSGEHEGYTRLVVQVPPDTTWSLKQTKNGARLNVALKDVRFQTSSVFQRLTENRLASISQPEAGGSLELEFGCECAASAFLFKDTMIVVDIAPGSFLPPLTSDIPGPFLPTAPKEKDTLHADHSIDLLALPLFNQNANGFEQQLSTRLLQGADRGIVDLNIAPVGLRDSTGNQSLFIPPEVELNVQVSSVLEELNGLLGPDIPHLERRPPCISSAELGFDDWSDERPFAEQAAHLRSGLYQEFDKVDREQALRLARLYAYSGFGAEALRALELVGQKSAAADRISAVARVLDDGPLADTNPFEGLQRCDGDAALWSVLTEGQLSNDANLIAMEQSFARLPDHLRRHVGPSLSDILVDADELEAARRVLRSVDRVETEAGPDVTQSKAKIASAEGDTHKAEDLLEDVLSASDAALDAPLALARLVEKRWTERGSISPRELGLAASYVVEYRRSDIGPLMQQTQALALSLAQEFDAAIDLLDALPNDPDGAETRNRVMLVLTERADDATFLRRVLNLPNDQMQALTTDTAVAVANRLATLGFSRQVSTLAKRPQDRDRRRERSRLRAKAALFDLRPHQAMLDLGDDPSDEATALRADALTMIGDLGAAAELLNTFGQQDAANRLNWLADLPVEAGTDDKFARIAQTTVKLSAPPSRLQDTPLADAASLLADSAATRQNIADLLAAIEPEHDGPRP